MSSRIFQNVIIQMKDVINRTIGVVDERGYVVSCSDLSEIGIRKDEFQRLTFSDDSVLTANGKLWKPLSTDAGKFEYVAFIEGEDSESRMILSLATVAFNESKLGYDEKHNKAAFIKNVILDNILPGDVYVRAKELNFVTDDARSVILVRQKESADVAATEVIQKLLPDRQNDFVININETDIVIIKRLVNAEDPNEPVAVAQKIQKTLHEELGIVSIIGISTVASHIRELADRYKESQVSIDVGAIFDTDKSIIRYDSLGLGRIIYQLPTTLCQMFLNEVFKRNPIETLDEDTLDTINRFFENNLNVSETSRKLYVHRNTLVYRLEKIKKLTGLDLSEFDHAIIFKVAMMVKQYLDSLGIK